MRFSEAITYKQWTELRSLLLKGVLLLLQTINEAMQRTPHKQSRNQFKVYAISLSEARNILLTATSRTLDIVLI
jgi:hypothetical protein